MSVHGRSGFKSSTPGSAGGRPAGRSERSWKWPTGSPRRSWTPGAAREENSLFFASRRQEDTALSRMT